MTTPHMPDSSAAQVNTPSSETRNKRPPLGHLTTQPSSSVCTVVTAPRGTQAEALLTWLVHGWPRSIVMNNSIIIYGCMWRDPKIRAHYEKDLTLSLARRALDEGFLLIETPRPEWFHVPRDLCPTVNPSSKDTPRLRPVLLDDDIQPGDRLLGHVQAQALPEPRP